MEQFGSRENNFVKFYVAVFFLVKTVQKIEIWFKQDKNNDHFKLRLMVIYACSDNNNNNDGQIQ